MLMPSYTGTKWRFEWKIRHIIETCLILLANANLHSKFWLYAFQTTTFLINWLPTKVMNLHSFFQTLFGHPPNYKFLQVFGCLCFPYIRPYNNHKLQYRSIQCLFLGLDPFKKDTFAWTSQPATSIFPSI